MNHTPFQTTRVKLLDGFRKIVSDNERVSQWPHIRAWKDVLDHTNEHELLTLSWKELCERAAMIQVNYRRQRIQLSLLPE
jgi:hypothetical protein